MDPIPREQWKDLHEHAWKHFTVHAQQRLTSFHFYLLLCTVICGGVLAMVKEFPNPLFAAFLALLLPLLSIVFQKLDNRNQELIEHSERALIFLESQLALKDDPHGRPHVLKVFTAEDLATARLESQPRWLYVFPRHFKYGRCFTWVFWGTGILGCVLFVVLLFTPPKSRNAQQDQPGSAAATTVR